MSKFQDSVIAHVEALGGSVYETEDGKLDVTLDLYIERDWFKLGFLTMANGDLSLAFVKRYNELRTTGQMPASDIASFEQHWKETKSLLNGVNNKFVASGRVTYFALNPRRYGNFVPILI